MEQLSFNDKKHLNEWLTSEDGQKLVNLLKEMQESHLNMAQGMYLKLADPNEQIAAQVNQAAGIKEVLGFIETIAVEVKERKKEEQKAKEL
jgi:hypothetical protein